MASLAVENYVKAIFKIVGGQSDRRATTGQLAGELNVSPGTVTSMLKSLSQNGLVAYTPYEGVRLTSAGSRLALRILRRHRLIELFLHQALQLDWDEVHEDAEQMEHVISDRLLERIDAYLGHPKYDPHGDPIPTTEGGLASRPSSPLSECKAGCRFRLARVLDQSPDFLRYLRQRGLSMEVQGCVVANLQEAGIVTVEIGGRETTFGREAAGRLLVTPRPNAGASEASGMAPA